MEKATVVMAKDIHRNLKVFCANNNLKRLDLGVKYLLDIAYS